jgi:hypothetical protein
MRRGLILASLLFTGVALFETVALAQSAARDAIPVESFLAELDRLREEVRAVNDAEAAAGVAARIPPQWRVTVDGGYADVDANWLITALKEAGGSPNRWQSSRTAILERLARVREESAAQHEPPAHARTRSALTSVLQRKEFQQSAASRWRVRLQQQVGDWLSDLWSRLWIGTGPGRDVVVVVAWLAALGALIGLAFVLARSWADRPRQPALNLSGGAAYRPRARELALRALDAARMGNSREAVRLAYAAALTRFEEHGAWRVDDARTPREYLQLVRAGDAHQPLLVDLTRRFERIWYGNRPVAPDDASRVTAHLEELGCLRPGERVI